MCVCVLLLLLLFSHSVISDSLWHHGWQHARFPCPSPSPRACSNLCASSWWCHPIISSYVVPFSSSLQSFPASGSFLRSQFCASDGQSIGDSASASVLPMNIKDWFPLGWTGLISLSPRDSQKSSPTPQFQSINSLVLSFLYGPTLISKHEYWKNQSFVYMDLCQQSNVSAFQYAVYVYQSFSSNKQASFKFMAAVTIFSDLGTQENKVCHCFHCFPIYWPWNDGTKWHHLCS